MRPSKPNCCSFRGDTYACGSCVLPTVLKAISASLNLRVLDRSLEAFALYPPAIQDGPPSVPVGDGEKSRSAHEGNAEKAGIVRQVLDGLGAQVDSQDLEAKEVLRAVQSDEEEKSIA